MPDRKNSGRKQATIINVEFKIGIRTSLDASNTNCRSGMRSSLGFRRFSRSRLYTFSTSTMASSTNEPMAMARPPRLMVLMVSPKAWSTRIAISMESGKAMSEIRVVRAFIRKKNSTITTKMAPSNKDFWMLLMELLMKRDCRKMSVEMRTSAGRVFCSSCMEASSLSVSSSVLVFGCLVTVTSTAGLPFSEARPNLGALAPICTSAMSDRVMGRSLTVLTTALPISSTWVVASTP